ncbi:MAG: plasmid stabilization protein [Bacteroidetes bacterium B1(2017)]|nr:MAG: plasmid stabilization protein [Bacteroidetes bacterium B1(2017)]
MSYKLLILPSALSDIQVAISYYNKQQEGLGKRFHQTIKLAFDTLKTNPFYQIKYDTIRCYYAKPFPYLIHFKVEEQAKTITIIAIIHTSRNPNDWPVQ